MSRLRLPQTPNKHAVRWGRIAAMIAALLVSPLGESAAWAQKNSKPEAAEPEVRGYTLPYFATGMALLLVVIPICWPAMRRWDLPFHEEE